MSAPPELQVAVAWLVRAWIVVGWLILVPLAIYLARGAP